ncbi:MAG: helix-turn-helix domain-containing protein [Candidatus Pacebacteria bacterium]|nr:helix-turn-helix domain-containing protein [Candidatus Paceibacterota bacterium]
MDKRLAIGDAAKRLGVSRDTLRRWEKKGKITPFRSPSNRRYYSREQLDSLLEKPKKVLEKKKLKKNSSIDSGSLKLVTYSLAALLAGVILAYLLQVFLF